MERNQTIYIVNHKDGCIEERNVDFVKNNYVVVKSKSDKDNSHRIREPIEWCFNTVSEAQNTLLGYREETKERIKNSQALEELFAAWADEYCDEKDFIQKEEMANFLNEQYGTQIEWKKARKSSSWESDICKYRHQFSI